MSNALGSISLAGLLLTSVDTAFAQNAPTKSVVIDQGVDQATLHRYNHLDQGEQLIPAAWLLALETADGRGKFMSPDNLRRLGFIVDGVTTDAQNPYGWAVGFVIGDPKTSGGIPMAGINCAACHTGQIDYKGTAIRINGGPGMLDSDGFFVSLFTALVATDSDPARRAKFYADAIKAGYPADRMEAEFGTAVTELRAAATAPFLPSTVSGFGRTDAIHNLANTLFAREIMAPANRRAHDGPVDFPYLWDVGRLTWLQYDGFQPGWMPLTRNMIESIAVFSKTNFVDPKTGELNPEPLRWQTSIQLDNLLWLEKTVRSLRAPPWPADVLGPIDRTKAERGKQLFTATCARCHGIKELPDGYPFGSWDVNVIPLQNIGTDPYEATGWSADRFDGSKLGLGKEVAAYDALPAVLNAIRKQMYIDNDTPATGQEQDTPFQ